MSYRKQDVGSGCLDVVAKAAIVGALLATAIGLARAGGVPPSNKLLDEYRDATAECHAPYPKNPRNGLPFQKPGTSYRVFTDPTTCLGEKGWVPFNGPTGYWCGMSKGANKLEFPGGVCDKPKEEKKPAPHKGRTGTA